MGAWIETTAGAVAWVCISVAPYVGAWIETFDIDKKLKGSHKSHPMWVRGLKPSTYTYDLGGELSHPMWVRGLKHIVQRKKAGELCVAPYVGAWIETRTILILLMKTESRTLCGCVD